MKYIVKGISTFLLCVTLFLAPKRSSAQGFEVSMQVFYDQLSPYGQWVDDPDYGYAWIPSSVDEDFTPYQTAGHWVFTDYGWTWVSDYDWGWATFHYGRWNYNDYYGWMWVPDTQWGPAWVAWRESPGYFGWAPLSPGINISINIGDNDIPPQRWVFVRDVDIVQPQIVRYSVPRTENVTIIRNTTIIKNTYVDRSRNVTYIAGPDRTRVQKVVNRPIQPVKIEESTRPEQKVNVDKLVIYRPRVQKAAPNGNKPAPPKVVPLQQVKKRAPQQQDNVGNSPGQQQQHSTNPALNNTKEQQQQKNPPVNNNNQQQQERKPQNENPPANNNNNQQQQQERKPQNDNSPSNNNKPDQLQQERKPQNDNPPANNNKPDQQQQERKPQNDNPPANNNKPDQQQQEKKPQNNNPPANNNKSDQQQQERKPQN